jgi:hypothetical protein
VHHDFSPESQVLKLLNGGTPKKVEAFSPIAATCIVAGQICATSSSGKLAEKEQFPSLKSFQFVTYFT